MNEMPSQRIDDELLRKIHAGDRAVFSSLVREHQRSVFFTAMRLSSGDEASARDIVQKAFLQAWTHRENFRGQASFKTWLLRITTNVAKNEQRRAWRRREFTPGEGTEEDFEPLTPEAETSFDVLASKRAREFLRDAVESLPQRQREIALLRIYEDLSFVEVAECCGTSANNAKVSFHHAVKNIRKFLAARGLAA